MLIQLETRVMAIGLGLGGLGALAALISMRYIRSDIKKLIKNSISSRDQG
ncbi:MAG: hypothetical protein A4E43_00707 [Methanosaeta sp. PtaB.Bin005]|nr:MAG: hypothetical protein A4E43_00707 [Methanosaeta sp. PtaB.Bin005]